MAARRYPLDKRFSVAISTTAYAKLRALNERHHLSNNYLLTVLLKNIDEIADDAKLDGALQRFIAKFGAPGGGMASMEKRSS
ncbi:MAG: hypothetical protein AAFR71_02485 [Pseudomonadota bacterium]